MKSGALALFFLLCSVQSGLCDDCDRVVNAIVKMEHTPYRNTSVNDRTSMVFQEIFTGDKIYEKTGDGDWKAKPKTSDDLEADFQRAHKSAKWVCKADGTDIFGGRQADVIAVHDATSPAKADNHYWIYQGSGLLFKMEINTVLGNAPIQIMNTYDYNAIQAPTN